MLSASDLTLTCLNVACRDTQNLDAVDRFASSEAVVCGTADSGVLVTSTAFQPAGSLMVRLALPLDDARDVENGGH